VFDQLLGSVRVRGKITVPAGRKIMFQVAEAYEVMMGRFSRQLAPLFIQFTSSQVSAMAMFCLTH
jgi:hypothetical protein